jgi:hypothetical protein
MDIVPTSSALTFKFHPRPISGGYVFWWLIDEQTDAVTLNIDTTPTPSGSFYTLSRTFEDLTESRMYYVRMFDVLLLEGSLTQLYERDNRQETGYTLRSAQDFTDRAYDEGLLRASVCQLKLYCTDQPTGIKHNIYDRQPMSQPAKPSRNWIVP